MLVLLHMRLSLVQLLLFLFKPSLQTIEKLRAGDQGDDRLLRFKIGTAGRLGREESCKFNSPLTQPNFTNPTFSWFTFLCLAFTSFSLTSQLTMHASVKGTQD
jgi:hypothetical protein